VTAPQNQNAKRRTTACCSASMHAAHSGKQIGHTQDRTLDVQTLRDHAAWPKQPVTLSKPAQHEYAPLCRSLACRASAALAPAPRPVPAASPRGQRQRAAAQQQVAPREAQREHGRGLGGQRAQRPRRRAGRAVRRRRPGGGPCRGAPQLDRMVGAACPRDWMSSMQAVSDGTRLLPWQRRAQAPPDVHPLAHSSMRERGRCCAHVWG
jgi:hypothetical protein